jgi:glycerophosphoryl diester phosphodiesterase
MKIIGHRGVAGEGLENTLHSIAAAIAQGADMVEVDVVVLPTGEVVLMHDNKVDRTTNGQGLITSIPFEQLRQLDAGNGQRIPTLQEVIEHIDGRIPLNIEIKSVSAARLVADILRHYIRQGWNPNHFLVSSFNHRELHIFKSLLPSVSVCALIYSVPLDYAAYAGPLGADIVAPAVDLITQEFVDDAHSRGLEIYAWVWQPVYDEEIIHLYDMRVDGFYADFVGKTRELIQSHTTSVSKRS